jgi:hypothetical protein
MTRVGSQRHKKKVHLVGYFYSCITMHGVMNVKNIHTYNNFPHTSQINFTQQSANFRCFVDHLMTLIQ